jgi:hypothetical protein
VGLDDQRERHEQARRLRLRRRHGARPKAKALAFGKTIRVATMRCTSRTDGVRCANGRGHGFLIGRAAYRLF